MTPELAHLSRTVDPVALGGRIKGSRVAAGLTQQEAAEGMVSAAYISRIEAGNRRPDVRLLEHLAERLNTTVEALIVGVRRDDLTQAELELELAELELLSGAAEPALHKVQALLAGDLVPHDDRLAERARLLLAQSLVAVGRHEEAISQLERMVITLDHDTAWLRALASLSRCYRETGELGRAVEVGLHVFTEIDGAGLSDTDEAIQLYVTVAAASVERGDVEPARELIQEIIERTSRLGTATARASAYWKASRLQARQGEAESALLLAQKAVALMTQGEDARSLARLKGALAGIQIRQDPPDIEGARATADEALTSLSSSDAGEIDTVRVQLTMAKIDFVDGRYDDALRTATLCLAGSTEAPLMSAEAELVLGRIHLAQGNTVRARDAFQRSARALSAIGTDRRAGETWFELGTLLQQLGDEGTALDAFRRAAASTGMQQATGLATPLQTPQRSR